MRSIIKKIAALGDLISIVSNCNNRLADYGRASLLIILGLFSFSTPLMAATEPDTTLTNVVVVNYTVGNGSTIQTDASVSLVTSTRTPAQISFYSEFQGGDNLTIKPTVFSPDGSDNNWQPLNHPVQGPTSVIQTISFSEGEPLIIRLEDFDQNVDSAVYETVIVDLEIPNTGDVERLELIETAPDSGVFTGVIDLVDTSLNEVNNGQLSVEALSEINARYEDNEDQTDTAATVGIVDPSNVVFDSTTGEPINGATITLVYTGGGQGSRVFDQDNGDWPSTVVSGSPVVASSTSRNIPMGAGEFQFPRVLGGDYTLKVIPPVGYSFPSQQSQSQLQQLGAIANQVANGSRGEEFSIVDALGAVLMNIPLDPFNGRFSVSKKVDQNRASIGDVLTYTVVAQNNDPIYSLQNVVLNDTLPPGFRYLAGSAKNSNGTELQDGSIAADGRKLNFSLGTLIANTTQQISYKVVVGAGSPNDVAVNSIQGVSSEVESNVATASVEMFDELMTTKNILIGRVYSGDCTDPKKQLAIKNARLYLDNGRTVITDADGRWHLEGLTAGTHAIQLDETSLPAGMVASSCHLDSRNAKQPHSKVLNLKSGHLWRVDFHVEPSDDDNHLTKKVEIKGKAEYQLPVNPLDLFDAAYTEKAEPGFEFVWPPAKHVPALSTLKIAIKHPSKQRLSLLLNGEKVSPINFEGSDSNKAKTVSVMRWTGVDIKQTNNTLTAILEDTSGKEIKRIERYVHFTEYSSKASLVPEASTLVADGISTPVIAIRLEDEQGFTPRPRTNGFFTLDQNDWKVIKSKQSGVAVDLNQSQDGKYAYTVSDDGLLRVRLEPTTKSGHITINVALNDGKTESVRAWLKPALRDWIMVGFANGTVGHKTLSGNMETLSDLGNSEGLYKDSSISFFAKGRIRGDYLLTVAYDSNKQSGEVGEQLQGVIDPKAWYTLYGDEQQQRHETPSSSKLYLRLEKEQFYALFGDFATEMDTTELGRYERVLHGLKSSYSSEKFEYTAFASETSHRYQRDEIQGDGTSGLYYLSRLPVNQSEQISLETRDRDDLGTILNTRTLQRYSDYDINYESKSLFFKFPISGSDDAFNPIYIVVDYESEDDAGDKVLAIGGRFGVKALDGRLKSGVTYLKEDEDQLLALYADLNLSDKVTVKAEAAKSSSLVDAEAWNGEVSYRDQQWQARLFAKQQETGFGLNQQSSLTEGERNVGVSVQYSMTDDQLVAAALSKLDKLDNDDERIKQSISWQKQAKDSKVSVGYHKLEETSNGVTKTNDTIRVGANKSFNDGKFALSVQLDKAIDSEGSAEQNPDRLKFGLDYKLSDRVSVFAEQEYAENDLNRHSNSRVGLKSRLWEGGNVHTDLLRKNNDQNDGSARNYAVLGLSQHWKVDDHLHLDFSIDKAKTLDWINYTPLSDSSTLTINADDYLSVSIGAGWNNKDWSATGRAEYRDSDASTRRSLQYNAVRKLGDHYAVSKQARVIDTQQANGDSKRQTKFGFGFVVRSKNHDYTVLNQMDYIDDTSLTAGIKSRTSKFINNLHVNRQLTKKLELSIHHGAKLTQTDESPEDWGVTDTLQLGARYDINESWDVGAQAGYLHHWDTQTKSDFAGVSIGFAPAKNTRVELGYNMEGFSDDDFTSENYTHEGPYININYLLDQSLLKIFDRPEK